MHYTSHRANDVEKDWSYMRMSERQSQGNSRSNLLFCSICYADQRLGRKEQMWALCMLSGKVTVDQRAYYVIN